MAEGKGTLACAGPLSAVVTIWDGERRMVIADAAGHFSPPGSSSRSEFFDDCTKVILAAKEK